MEKAPSWLALSLFITLFIAAASGMYLLIFVSSPTDQQPEEPTSTPPGFSTFTTPVDGYGDCTFAVYHPTSSNRNNMVLLGCKVGDA